jgi:hypothetical protein
MGRDAVRWFGEPWEAEVNESCEQGGVPVGEECVGCGEEVAAGDRGFLVPDLRTLGMSIEVDGLAHEWEERPWHLRCMMISLLGPGWETMVGAVVDAAVADLRLARALADADEIARRDA